MRLEKLIPGAHAKDVTDPSIEAAVVELVVVKMRTASHREISYFFDKEGTLVAITDPGREARNWSK